MATLDDVYRKYGEVSEASQLLEVEIGNLVLEARLTDFDLEAIGAGSDARAILDRINKGTLGALLLDATKALGGLDAADLFADALAERNRLTHAFFRHHNFRRNTAEGRDVMLADLESIHATVLAAYKAALAISGIDLDSFEQHGDITTHVDLD